ncbi:MerR family transcriptional regulator [Heyndrickxia ginsengihumi]|uniref:MerR family transcriptional regulator n=1 Tax=Heyndrickxia ginsengihumi TaxID=363870 RepID=UPI00203EA14A|nr:MerR family transcriptional regulator [Heyndrickxia ginsengihumi]MCM3024070.1 MerR family transcriptional regulator [Heyndrickxia ginsengihumi]
MRIKEVADLVGISVRTLHHYDEIGLLVPDQVSDTGYRIYSENNLALLQQILFFKELGFPLQTIKQMIYSPSFDRYEALTLQRKMLIEKRVQLDQMIATIEKTMQHMKGEVQMTNEEKFAGFQFDENPYEQEARKRWGNDKVDEANARLRKLSNEQQLALREEMNAIFKELADLRSGFPASKEAQVTIKKWFDLLNQQIGQYSFDAFKGLGQLYVDDERFTKNIDAFGEGLAQFMSQAMRVFAERQKEEAGAD